MNAKRFTKDVLLRAPEVVVRGPKFGLTWAPEVIRRVELLSAASVGRQAWTAVGDIRRINSANGSGGWLSSAPALPRAFPLQPERG